MLARRPHALSKKPDPWAAITRLKACSWSGDAKGHRMVLHAPVPEELADYKASYALPKVVYPHDLPRVVEWLDRCGREANVKPIDYRMIHETQGVTWVRQWGWTSGRSNGTRIVDGIIQVLDEQKTREAECLWICERERTSIGQELHDDLCQLLAGISCMIEVIGKKAEKTMPEVKETCADLSAQLHAGIERTRALAHGLVPSRIIKLGMGLALNELARQTIVQRQVMTTVRTPPSIPKHDPESILHVYRIAQESVSNAIRHGRATRIEIRLQLLENHLRLTVRDNGFGLPPASSCNSGIGLHIMQYRAGILGGSVKLGNLRSGGALVELLYPHSGVPHRIDPTSPA